MSSNLRWGAVSLTVIVLALWVVFTRPDPFHDTFTLRAVLSSSTGIRPGITPVRIAGVDVGKVTDVESYHGTRNAVVTMELEKSALPLHADATAKMRPRLFLEGNSFIDLSPGTPTAAVAKAGTTIPLSRTAVAVTFPAVTGALTASTRKNLQTTLFEYGRALRGGAAGLNSALHHAAIAMPSTAVLSDAMTGESPGDLRRAVDGFADVAAGLDDAGPELPGALSALRRSSGAFASESASLRATLRALPGALTDTEAALRQTGAALPPARELARTTTAALPALSAPFESGVPWLRELTALLGPDELGGDLDELLPATRSTTPALKPTTGLLEEIGSLSRCSTRVLVPTAKAQIDDGPRSAHTSVWSEFLSAVVGAGGSAENFDGNGYMLRGNPGGGNAAVKTGKTRWLGEPAYGNAIAPPLGTRPAAPKALPDHRPEAACDQSRPPKLDAATGPADGSAP